MRNTAILVLLALPALCQEHVDLGIVDRIKAEAFERSKVMETLRNLSDVHGPRLTGSPEYEDAARWAMGELNGYGVDNVHFEKWGPFGRAWTLEQSSLELIEPQYSQLTAVPLAWSASTNGPISGDLVLAPLRASIRADGPKKYKEALQAYRVNWSGKLRGKIVLLSVPEVPAPQNSPQFRRYTSAELAALAEARAPSARITAKRADELEWPEDPAKLSAFLASVPAAVTVQLYDLILQLYTERDDFFAGEGVAGVLLGDERAHEGLLFGEAAGGWKAAGTPARPTFVVTAEQYNRIARLVEKQNAVRVRMSLKATMSDRDVDGLNIIGEIPGGDRKDEIVMVGAHLDSWHTGTGATDNGAGSAVMIEVMRILKALNLKLDRTVRIGLWSGEEQGMIGSRAYVKEHFADPNTMRITSEHSKLSGYFNLDGGSGKIRGVYLQSHEAMRPIFEAWLAPFRDLGVTTVSIRDTGSTDHLSFEAVGLPGFEFIQDPLDYSTITHHSDMDTWDHAIPEDLAQASAVIATVVYQAATRKEMLPRRELPKPE